MKIIGLTKYTILLLTLAIFLVSCEGFKMLIIHNRTGQEITIKTKSARPVQKGNALSDTKQVLSDLKEYKIPADSSLTLLSAFRPLLFNAGIKEADLATDYLIITTSKDTIVAENRTEILKLAKNEKTKFQKQTDKAFAIDDNKNIEAIVIRK